MMNTGIAVGRRRAFIQSKTGFTLPGLRYSSETYLYSFQKGRMLSSSLGKSTLLVTGLNISSFL